MKHDETYRKWPKSAMLDTSLSSSTIADGVRKGSIRLRRLAMADPAHALCASIMIISLITRVDDFSTTTWPCHWSRGWKALESRTSDVLNARWVAKATHVAPTQKQTSQKLEFRYLPVTACVLVYVTLYIEDSECDSNDSWLDLCERRKTRFRGCQFGY